MFGIGSKLTLVMLVLIGFIGASFALYFKYANNKIEGLVDERSKLEISLVNIKNNYNTLQQQVDKLNENLITLEKNRNDIYNDNNKEKIIFEEHDLGVLLKAKPKLMESRINKAIEQRFEDFEKL